MDIVRPAAVAGRFYPAQPAKLKNIVQGYLDDAPNLGLHPTAIIVPHAGYIYSGPIAGFAYRQLAALTTIERVVLLGPSHFAPFKGLALSSADRFASPLGEIPLDAAAAKRILSLPQVTVFDAAHAQEHSLEVQLPFLQMTLSNFKLVPLAVGDVSPEEVAEVLELLWDESRTLIVISSDLSHFHNSEAAAKLDRATAAAIEGLNPHEIKQDQACGRIPVQGLLHLARKLGWQAQTVDLRNSGDTAGPKDRVVGYGAWVFS